VLIAAAESNSAGEAGGVGLALGAALPVPVPAGLGDPVGLPTLSVGVGRAPDGSSPAVHAASASTSATAAVAGRGLTRPPCHAHPWISGAAHNGRVSGH
jgi:hypothetical protein